MLNPRFYKSEVTSYCLGISMFISNNESMLFISAIYFMYPLLKTYYHYAILSKSILMFKQNYSRPYLFSGDKYIVDRKLWGEVYFFENIIKMRRRI